MNEITLSSGGEAMNVKVPEPWPPRPICDRVTCGAHGPLVSVTYAGSERCPLCVAYDEITAQVARDAAGATPITWQDSGSGSSYEEHDLLLTIEQLPAVRSDDLAAYRASVWLQAAAARMDVPIFRVSAESLETAKHALQTWLDQHSSAWRSS